MTKPSSASRTTKANDEYTDYSCSTSIERLARDVETLLRSWHVDKGNDRHISMLSTATSSIHSSNQNNNVNGTSNAPSPSGASSISSQISTSTDAASTKTPNAAASPSAGSAATATAASLLLRSDSLTWNISLTTSSPQRMASFTVELQLALWDGPSVVGGGGRGVDTNPTTKDGEIHSHTQHQHHHHHDSSLPHSLRRPAHMSHMPSCLFENFSHLFGIGQHITLTPRHFQQHSTPASSSSASSAGNNNNNNNTTTLSEEELLQVLVAQSILQRHDDDKTARWMLHQVLSGWLQTALNCAVSSCHCCIPVFGVWGPYHPPTTTTTTNYNSNNAATTARRPPTRAGDLTVFPSWLQMAVTTKLPPPPRQSRKQFLERRHYQNDQYVPPLLTGMVLPTAVANNNCANYFWCSVIPGRPTSESCRLTMWGSILLQHCPEDTVVLWCARHVFGWWKQPLQKATAFSLLFHPDDYQYEKEDNPYTAWRRRPKIAATTTMTTKKTTTATAAAAGQEQAPSSPSGVAPVRPKITISNSMDEGVQHQVIDLTGDDEADTDDDDYDDDDDTMEAYYIRLEKYQDQCRALATNLVEQAAGASASEPYWGPIDDPVASIHATVTWNGSPAPASSNANTSTNSNNTVPPPPPPRQPLLSFPLRIRSRYSMSQEDWIEMEESVERTILDPLRPCQFQLQTWWDRETPVASLAATQQCILAALIRCATLPDETLLKHITDDAVLEQWDNDSGNVVASCLAQQANVGPTTRSLVDAMDWFTAAEDKMDVRDAEVLVRHIMRPDNGSSFPTPPVSPLSRVVGGTVVKGQNNNNRHVPRQRNKASFVEAATAAAAAGVAASPRQGKPLVESKTAEAEGRAAESHNGTSTTNNNSSSGAISMNTFAPLFKSAPIGRLVSILCVHMARLRSPCSMAMLWMAFCHEVRIRWEHRLSLPHMNQVPGLDPSPMEMKERNQGLTTLGVKAEQAGYWQGPATTNTSTTSRSTDTTPPDVDFPGDHHCLIGQKLQVRLVFHLWLQYQVYWIANSG
jgi:hypothetical protein